MKSLAKPGRGVQAFAGRLSRAASRPFEADLVFDLGLNDGSDTAFYLAKGFRVVGVEANPILYRAALDRFANEIQQNRVALLNVGVWSEPRTLPFFVNKANDHWSSFDSAYGCRDGTAYDVIDVPCLTIRSLIENHGRPYYLKIDIEGADKIVSQQLRNTSVRPPFISVEEYGVQALDDLQRLGYRQFAFVAQSNKLMKPPCPAREGSYVDRTFSDFDSGRFGRELPGPWLPYAAARNTYLAGFRREDSSYVGPENQWFDIHAR